MNKFQSARLYLCLGVGVALSLLAPPAPVSAQLIRYEGKAVSLAQVLERLRLQSGYEFQLQDPGKEAETGRHDVNWTDAPLGKVLADLSAAFNVEFFSASYTGFFVVERKKPEEKEYPAGPFRMRASNPFATVDPGAFQMALMFNAADEAGMESIAGIEADLRVVDNFGRPLVVPGAPTRITAPRTLLNEYWHRLQLTAPDNRSVRIRSISGTLMLYQKVVPERFEFDLAASVTDQVKVERNGVKIELAKATTEGQECAVTTHMAWPAATDVVGRGISRKVLPYLVDDQGRVYRDFSPRSTVSRESGEVRAEQLALFREVAGKPVRLVYEVWVREEPTGRLPFKVTGLPLPGRELPESSAASRAFYAAKGGGLKFRVVDRGGKPVEGEVSLGVTRKEASGWGSPRWMDLLTDPDGWVVLDHLQPGTYRLKRRFRLAPGATSHQDTAVLPEVTVKVGKETPYPNFKLPIAAPPEP